MRDTRTLPTFYFQHRPDGTEKWSDPIEIHDRPSIRDAMERSEGLFRVGSLPKGKLYEFRLFRNGVPAHTWTRDGRE
jgi:hypothetical protein